MYRKMAILLITMFVLVSVIQPVSAAGGAIASRIAELRPQATGTAHPSPSPGAIVSKIADLRSSINNNTIRPVSSAKATANTKLGDLRLQATKAVVSGSIDSAVNSLNRFSDGIDNSKLTDSQKALLAAQIQDNLSWFNDKNDAVKASTDMAAALSNARDASDRWNSVLPDLKKEVGLMASDNVAATIVNARNASTVISGKIATMNTQGKDTSALSAALASYNGHVDSAEQHVANARVEFNAISGKYDGHYAAGLRQLNLAGSDLKSAYSDLKKIYRLAFGSNVQVS